MRSSAGAPKTRIGRTAVGGWGGAGDGGGAGAAASGSASAPGGGSRARMRRSQAAATTAGVECGPNRPPGRSAALRGGAIGAQ